MQRYVTKATFLNIKVTFNDPRVFLLDVEELMFLLKST